jgi:N-acetylglutamate synthase-like GNAT family acetyltransferase
VLELRRMFVAAAWRGEPHRIAEGLLAALLEHAGRSGMQALWLGTSARFARAHRFYARHGFRRVARAEIPGGFVFLPMDDLLFHRPVRA